MHENFWCSQAFERPGKVDDAWLLLLLLQHLTVLQPFSTALHLSLLWRLNLILFLLLRAVFRLTSNCSKPIVHLAVGFHPQKPFPLLKTNILEGETYAWNMHDLKFSEKADSQEGICYKKFPSVPELFNNTSIWLKVSIFNFPPFSSQSLKLHTAHITTTQLYGTSSWFGRFIELSLWLLQFHNSFAEDSNKQYLIVKTRMTWSEISYMSGCLRISWHSCVILDEVPKKEDRISTVIICNATAGTHNRKFGTVMVAGQLDCPAPTFETSCLSNPLNLPLFLPFFSIVDRNIAMHHGKLQELQVTRYDFCEGWISGKYDLLGGWF